MSSSSFTEGCPFCDDDAHTSSYDHQLAVIVTCENHGRFAVSIALLRWAKHSHHRLGFLEESIDLHSRIGFTPYERARVVPGATLFPEFVLMR